MTRSQVYILLSCLFTGLGILFAFYTVSPISKEIPRAGFDREFFEHPIRQKAVMDIKVNSFYIAGQTEYTIYLGNSTAPFHVLIVNRTLTDSTHVMLTVELDSITEPRRFKLTVDSPWFYLANGVMPKQLRGKTNEWIAEDFLGQNAPYFVESTPLGVSSFAVRYYSKSQEGYELAKVTLTDTLNPNHTLLNKQLDGAFCLDGQLHYSKQLARLVYQHYYRNEFVVADSDLNLIYRSHTIDTFSRAQVNVTKLSETNRSMLSAPPAQINGIACVSEKYLFVKSNLLAKNENIERFMTESTIDTYDLATGEYLGSFYIPKYESEPLMDFSVQGNQLIVISDHYLVTYDLDLKNL